MKSIFKHKLLSFVLVISLLLVYVPAFAINPDTTEVIMDEDFQDGYSTSTNLRNKGFIVWHGANIGSDGTNQYLLMNRTDSGTDAQTAVELSAEPTSDKVIVSLDFMMPEDPESYDAWLFGVLNDSDRGKAVSNIQLSDGTLYDGASTSTNVVNSGLKEDTWYKAFLLVDLGNDTYTLYSGGQKSEMKNFQSSKSYTKTNIFFNVRVKSMDTPLYIDNVEIFGIVHEELEIALLRAQSILMECEVGFENGQYPEAAYNVFKSCYDEVALAAESSLSSEKAEEYATLLDNAITNFTESRIDETAQDGVARYLVFTTPDDIAVGNETVTRELTAEAYDRANQLVDTPITWSIEEGISGVSVDGNTLTVAGGTRGSIVLKATAGNVYDYHTLSFTEGRTIRELSVDAKDGTVFVEGKFSGKPLETVNISVAGTTISENDALEVDSDGSFAWSKNVNPDTVFQFITVRFSGNDTSPYSEQFPYYGTGWEDAVLEAFNGAASETDIEPLVKTFSAGIQIPLEMYLADQEDYDSVIYGGIPYTSISSLVSTVIEFECVISFSRATGETIESAINAHKEILEDNGFDLEAFENLTYDQTVIFYADVMDLTFDKNTDTVSGIVADLNLILENINKPSTGENESKAVTTILKDDFESYEIGSTSGGGGYIRWGGDKILEDGNNQFLQMLREADARARIAMEFEEEPDANDVIISWDFMMPEAPSGYKADLMSVLSDDGNSPSFYIHLENGTVYSGKTTSTAPMKTNLQQGKWYNAFLHIDLVADTYTLYIDEKQSDTSSFEKPVTDKTDIFFNIENYNYDIPLYYDNFELSAVIHKDLAISLYRARSVMKNCEIGYTAGKYPQTAYNMLENTYNTVFKASCDEKLTASQATVYANALSDAIDTFNNNKIGSGGSNVASYIIFEIPGALGIDDVAGYSGDLNATVYNSSNSAISIPVTWALAQNYSGVSLSGNRLNVNPGVRGEIVVRASAGNIYDEHTIKLVDCKEFIIFDVDSRNGKVSITGELSAIPLEDVEVSVVGNGLNLDGVLNVADDKTFAWTHNVDANLPYGTITVTLEGFDTPLVQKEVPFYGVGWENAVLTAFNSANSKDAVKTNIDTYYIGLDIDKKEFNKYSEDYSNRIYNSGTDYQNFTSLKNAVEDLQFIIAFYETTRTDIESDYNDYMSTMERNGFNKTDFDRLSDDQKIGVYVSTLAVQISTSTTTATVLVGELNKIVTDATSSDIIENPDDDEGSNKPGNSGGSLGGGGSSGGGSGGGSSSKEDLYDIELVPGQQQIPSEGTENVPSTTPQFADAHLTPWANDALLFVREKGIMIGDGTNVRPTDVVTRGEFAKIISVAFELAQKDSGKTFNDSGNKWWKEYAKIVSAYGIMNGIEESVFGGEERITRQMMAVSIYRVLSVSGKELYDQNTGVAFSDSDTIADYAKEAVEYLAQKGIVSGIGNGLFAPELPVKRAEVAQIIYNILTIE